MTFQVRVRVRVTTVRHRVRVRVRVTNLRNSQYELFKFINLKLKIIIIIHLSLSIRCRRVRCCGPHDPPPCPPVLCCSSRLSQTQSCYDCDVLDPSCRGSTSPSASIHLSCNNLLVQSISSNNMPKETKLLFPYGFPNHEPSSDFLLDPDV